MNLVFLVLTGLSLEVFPSQTVNVSLRGTAVLPCFCTHKIPIEQLHVEWRKAEGQLVAQLSQGQFTAGPGYEGRVQLPKNRMEDGDFSLIVSSVEYNDEGLYDCCIGFECPTRMTLDVSVSTDRNISALVGDNITLPCFANVDKQANISQLNIHWMKDGETVLDIQSGAGTGFENRVHMSSDHVRLGDLSLTLSILRLSDRGTYRCFLNSDQGTPDGIVLTVAGSQSNITIQSSQSLFLPLHATEPVHVLFSSGGSTSVPVCIVKGGSLDCGPQYQHRASVHNSTLILKYATQADSGVYRVMDNWTNYTINTVFVSVTVPPAEEFTVLTVLLVLESLLLLLMIVQEFKKKRMKHKNNLYLLFPLLLLNLVLMALLVTVTLKPGQKELYWALGVGLGLFLVFKMVIVSVTCEKLVKMRKEKTSGGRLKLVFLVLLLMLLVFSVAGIALPRQMWLNLIPFPLLGLSMILDMLIMYKPLQYFREVMRTVQNIENSNCYEFLQESHVRLVVSLMLQMLLWVVELGLSVVLVVKELWEEINLGLSWGLTVGEVILIILLCLYVRYIQEKQDNCHENKMGMWSSLVFGQCRKEHSEDLLANQNSCYQNDQQPDSEA